MVTDTAYQQAFTYFLDHTNEKEILLAKIKSVLQNRHVSSLLDIGAGDGSLAVPLSQSVEKYTAVEQNREFISLLQNQGLNVMEGTFPLAIHDTFDLILLCHAINRDPEVWKPLLSSALPLRNPGGTLLVVTWKNEDNNDWVNLIRFFGGEFMQPYHLLNNDPIREFLLPFGEVSTEFVESGVQTDTFEEMIQALAFVAGKGDAEKMQRFITQRERVRPLFEEKYKTTTGYFFPFQNYFIYCENR